MQKEYNTEADEDLVQTESRNDVGIVTMNNRKKLNSLSSQLVAGILKAFDDFEKSKVRAVIIRAYQGAKVWSAGHNIEEIPLDGQDPLYWNIPFEQLLHRV